MVSHQLTSPDLPEEYHHQIISSVSHHQHQLEEDFSEPQISLMTHYNNIYYETLEAVKEITIVEEEEVTEDYTDIEALETIQEVSEVYDTSELTDITETDFIEDIDDFPTFNLNDVDILDTFSKDFEEPIETIQDLINECPKSEIFDQEFDLSKETSENLKIVEDSNIIKKEKSQIYSDLYNLPSEPLENDFSITMVSHQLTSPDIPEEYHHQIISSVSHQQHQLEEDFSEPQISLMTHYNNIYYETLEAVKEITIVEEEEVTEDYTDIEALETIQEVSEVY